jgi:hypothetical protein
MGRATVTVVFTDLVGSTGLRARLGEAAITTLLRSHIRQTRGGGPLPRRPGHQGARRRHHGHVRRSVDAAAAAVAIQQAVARQNQTSANPIDIRIGLSAGWLARIRLEWAETLVARGGPDRAEQARALLDQTLVAARKLGLTTVERRALTLTEPG